MDSADETGFDDYLSQDYCSSSIPMKHPTKGLTVFSSWCLWDKRCPRPRDSGQSTPRAGRRRAHSSSHDTGNWVTKPIFAKLQPLPEWPQDVERSRMSLKPHFLAVAYSRLYWPISDLDILNDTPNTAVWEITAVTFSRYKYSTSQQVCKLPNHCYHTEPGLVNASKESLSFP